jgi:hypothetical protein
LHWAKPSTAWTGLFSPKHSRFFLQEFLNGSLGHRTGRVDRDLFDVVGIEIEIWADLFVNAPRHNFPPPLRHTSNRGRIHQQ